MICFVNGGIDLLQGDEILLNPFTKDVITDVHMAGGTSWLLCVCHSCTCVVVLVEPTGSFLWNV